MPTKLAYNAADGSLTATFDGKDSKNVHTIPKRELKDFFAQADQVKAKAFPEKKPAATAAATPATKAKKDDGKASKKDAKKTDKKSKK